MKLFEEEKNQKMMNINVIFYILQEVKILQIMKVWCLKALASKTEMYLNLSQWIFKIPLIFQIISNEFLKWLQGNLLLPNHLFENYMDQLWQSQHHHCGLVI